MGKNLTLKKRDLAEQECLGNQKNVESINFRKLSGGARLFSLKTLTYIGLDRGKA